MRQTELATLFDYMYWANRRILDTAARLTNAQFTQFVDETGYLTLAEQAPDPRNYPDLTEAFAIPGSLVFHKTDRPVSTDDPSQWWRFVAGADWCHPLGPDSSIAALEDHPVVQIAYQDALTRDTWPEDWGARSRSAHGRRSARTRTIAALS